jgi:hypothetical protein
MKGQQKGVWSTKVRALVTINIELGTQDPPPPTIKKHYNIFVVVYKLLDTVHIDQTSAFPITLQQGYRYIMVGIHLDANFIFCKLTEKNQGRDDQCMPTNGQQDETLGNWVETSSFRQRVFGKIQIMHHKDRNDAQVSSPGLPPLQHCQTGNPNVQEPFHLHSQQSQ